jgi:putative membrane-bound dehydrogenase-like protein
VEPTAEPTQAPSPTTEPSPTPQAEPDGPLQLAPVTLETSDATRQGVFEGERTINLPPGFHIKVYATGLNGVRWLGLSPGGLVYATVRGNGQVVTLPDADKDGVADEVKVFADNLPGVHGIEFRDAGVYVATESEIIRLEDTDDDGVADKRDVLASDLPSGGGHSTRTLAFGPDGKLYVSAGSSCNVCVEDDSKRAAISRYSAEGKFEKVFAKGLRNAVGLEFNRQTGELWATNNGRDSLGDDVPPETIYNVREDADYGWPYCYGDRVPDETQDPPPGYCEKTSVPAVQMQAHSAPLGLGFYTGETFPEQFRGDMFVAFHGSWNRTVPTGYKIVRVQMKDGQPDTSAADQMVQDFATGWFLGADAFGRPVDVMTAPDGSLLVTDDAADAIYSIYYAENAGP